MSFPLRLGIHSALQTNEVRVGFERIPERGKEWSNLGKLSDVLYNSLVYFSRVYLTCPSLMLEVCKIHHHVYSLSGRGQRDTFIADFGKVLRSDNPIWSREADLHIPFRNLEPPRYETDSESIRIVYAAYLFCGSGLVTRADTLRDNTHVFLLLHKIKDG